MTSSTGESTTEHGDSATGMRHLAPLHPAVVHAPIGAVFVASVCDVVSTIGGDGQPWSRLWFKGGSYALIVGTTILFIAVITGFVDRNRWTVRGTPARRVVNRHALVMSLVGIVSVVDLTLRNDVYPDAFHTPTPVLASTLAALALTMTGGRFGGHLVYRHGIAVATAAADVAGSGGELGLTPHNEPGPMGPPRYKMALVTWLGLYPTIMAVLSVFKPLGVLTLPLPVRTLILTAIFVPLMVYVLVPILNRVFATWLHAGSGG